MSTQVYWYATVGLSVCGAFGCGIRPGTEANESTAGQVQHVGIQSSQLTVAEGP